MGLGECGVVKVIFEKILHGRVETGVWRKWTAESASYLPGVAGAG